MILTNFKPKIKEKSRRNSSNRTQKKNSRMRKIK